MSRNRLFAAVGLLALVVLVIRASGRFDLDGFAGGFSVGIMIATMAVVIALLLGSVWTPEKTDG